MMMDAQQRVEIVRRYNEGLRAMSEAEMARMAAEQSEGMRQRGPWTPVECQRMQNLWGGAAERKNNFVPTPKTPTLWDRVKRVVLGSVG